MKFIILFIFLVEFITAQELFYQKNFCLATRDSLVSIEYQGEKYNLYFGIISPDGKLVAGTLFDSTLSNNPENGLKETKLDVILYSLENHSVIFNTKTIGFPDIYFIDSLFILIDLENIIITESQTGRILGRDCANSYRIINNDIYLSDCKKNFRSLYKYNIALNKFEYFTDAKKCDDKLVYLLADTLFFINRDRTQIIKSFRDEILDVYNFEDLTPYSDNCENFYVLGKYRENNFPARENIYKYDSGSGCFIKCFDSMELNYQLNLQGAQITGIQEYDNKLYFSASFFVGHQMRKNNVILSYDFDENKLYSLTNIGYYSFPFGFFTKTP